MSTSLEQWRQLGKALSDNAEQLAILESDGGEGVILDEVKKSFYFLEQHGFVEGHNSIGWSPTPLLLDLASALLREETRRRVVPDVNDWLAQLALDVSHYQDALIQGEDTSLRRYLQSIRNSVLRMRFAIKQEIHAIQHFLQTEFGHVTTLNQKIIENRYLIARTTELTNRLLFINGRELARLANDNSVLLRIFLFRFLPDIQHFRQELLAIIPQLDDMLWSLRKQDEKTRRLWAVSRYLSQGERLLNRELSAAELLTSPFNVQQSDADIAHIHIDNPDLQALLIDLVQRLPASSEPAEANATTNLVGQYEPADADDEEQVIEPCFMLPHRLAFIECAVRQQLSAKQYWDQCAEPGIPYAVWLQWIHGECANEPSFNMELCIHEGSQLHANLLVTDLTIHPRLEVAK